MSGVLILPSRMLFYQGDLPGWMIPVTVIVLVLAAAYQWLRRRNAAAQTRVESARLREQHQARSAQTLSADDSVHRGESEA
ncbi:hypothetical protein [Microbacterium trichothecenolyticum]|uniref:Cytochrome c-type biogenesis protein CcmH/NrfF n=1 Tax=Microbacterium trichothecenolyticum TaxID=69370 RepID=A0ABU0TX33_MICTR|nr:hypothetical protein [Microbacterium trichothecenolyticum]MDQ1124226.1 cytochrome c-type biogenesis protein CcmH/NrfF [Microbacterium trichothecenolyticum]